MTLERKPVAFGDLRGWIDALRAAGELHEIDAEVDWNIELGTIMRLAQGPGTGRALCSTTSRTTTSRTSRCRRIFGSALNNNRRIAMMLGLPPDTHARELVKIGRTILQESIAAAHRQGRPLQGERHHRQGRRSRRISRSPHWNRLDGGRYLITYAGVVTKDPDTDVMNVGIYRGMVGGPDKIPILMWRAQHIGHHVTAWQARGAQGNADRGRDRLGAVARLLRRLAGAEGHLRIRRDGRDPRRAGRSRQMRDHRPLRAGLGRDRDRGHARARARDLSDGRPLRRVHRLCRRRPLAEAHDPRDLHHPPQRSDPARHDRRLHARELFRERDDLVDLPLLDRLERARSRRRARASPTCGARRCRPAST